MEMDPQVPLVVRREVHLLGEVDVHMVRKTMRRLRWLSKDHFKGKKLPKTWKWEVDDCEECGHSTRYKVYASWYTPSTRTPTQIEIDKMIADSMKMWDAYITREYNRPGTGYIANLTVPSPP
jgi:Arc/MetJ family transcription regulator